MLRLLGRMRRSLWGQQSLHTGLGRSQPCPQGDQGPQYGILV